MNNDPGISREELHAFIDGELDPVRTEKVSKLLAADSILAEKVAAFQSDKERLVQTYGKLRELRLPAKWLQSVEERPVPQRQSFRITFFSRWGIAAVASSLLLAIGLWLAHEYFGTTNEDAIVAEALAARDNSMRPADVVRIASDESRPNEIIGAALSMRLRVPDLSKSGYSPSEVHVYGGLPGGNAVEITYRDARKRLFTLYLRHPNAPARIDLLERDGVRICIWQDDVLGTVMVGQMSAGEMARIASLAYSGLTS